MRYTRDRHLNCARGTDLPQSRLTDDIVREIRRNREGLTLKQLAKRYGVHHRTVEKVHYYETWRHVK